MLILNCISVLLKYVKKNAFCFQLVGEPFLQYGIKIIGVLDEILAVLEKLETKVRYKCKLFDVYRQEKDNEPEITIDEAEKKEV